jgi:predicted anti-sigma-YlaC factor YlaD
MNCEKCQELLSDFFDGAMSDADRATLGAHLEECLPCFNVHAELDSVVSFCRDHRGEYDAPPNEQALWLRIRNTVESGMFVSAATAQNPTGQLRRESWLTRMTGRSWELSFSQMAAAVAAIVVFASLATVFGLRGLQSNSSMASTNLNSSGSQTVALTANPNGSSKVFEPRDRLWQQQQINYWTQVVEQHKTHWNPQVRTDFERNLNLLDETVNESLEKLAQHPHDDVTEEMLNSALNDKMQLLKEFSDL